MNGLLLGALALGDPTIDSLDVYPAYNFSVPVDHLQNESRYVEDLITLSFSFPFPCFTFYAVIDIRRERERIPPTYQHAFAGQFRFSFGSKKGIRRHDQNKL